MPSAPEEVAPPPPPGIPTTLENSARFLFEDDDPVRVGVAPETIREDSIALVSGRVLVSGGTPLGGVRVTIHGHPEYGYTRTFGDGTFHMAINGIGPIVLNFKKTGYMPVQRHTQVHWQDWKPIEDVTMLPYDTRVTTVQLGISSTPQVARGSVALDADGERQATLLFPTGVTATAVLDDGSEVSLPELNIRATEYTVGEKGPSSMPGELPPQIAFTYAAEFSADEAILLGAKELRFSKAVYFYLENFIGFPVGGVVPMGYYDRKLATWVPSDNGKVIKIMGLPSGRALVDVDGDGVADSGAKLIELGLNDEELEALATLYPIGQELWRVPVPHFSAWDCNWPYGPPPDAIAPNSPPPEIDDPLEEPCEDEGSIIECENQILGQRIPLQGTGLTLNYRSDRVAGWAPERSFELQLTGASVPSSLLYVRLIVEIAGQRDISFFPPAANLRTSFTWNGKDGIGRQVLGTRRAEITIEYVYPAVYYEPSELGRAFGALGARIPIYGTRSSSLIRIQQKFNRTLRAFDARSIGFGGWTLQSQNFGRLEDGTIYLGSGGRLKGKPGEIRALRTPPNRPFSIATGPSGEVYSAHASSSNSIYVTRGTTRARLLDLNSTVVHQGDGTVKVERLSPRQLALAPDGRLFFGTTQKIFWVELSDSTVHWLGGSGTCGSSLQEGVDIKNARLCVINGLSFGPDGSLYVAESGSGRHRVFRVLPDGTLSNIKVDQANYPQFTADQILATSDSVYVLSKYRDRVWRIWGDGREDIVAQGRHLPVGNVDNFVDKFQSIAVVGPELYLAIVHRSEEPQTASDIGSTIARVVGPSEFEVILGDEIGIRNSAPGSYWTERSLGFLFHLAAQPDGGLVAYDEPGTGRLFSLARSGQSTASKDGRLSYRFRGGLHKETLENTTGRSVVEMEYDAENRLRLVRDGQGNEVLVRRQAGDIEVEGPYGHRSLLMLDANGYLARILGPDGEESLFEHGSGGLLMEITQPGNPTARYSFDQVGRLIRREDDAGGITTLTRQQRTDSHSVSLTSATGIKKVHTVERSSASSISRRVTLLSPNEDLEFRTEEPNRFARHSIAPDGTLTQVEMHLDPRWGNSSLYPGRTTHRLPSGLEKVTQMQRIANGPAIHEPGGIDELRTVVSVNGSLLFSASFVRVTNESLVRSASGRERRIRFDEKGLVTWARTGQLAPTVFAYDQRGRPLASWREVDGSQQRLIEFEYHATAGDPLREHMNGSLSSMSLPGTESSEPSREFGYEYDQGLRVNEISLPGQSSSSLQFGYAPGGRLGSLHPPGRTPHTFTHTPSGLVESYLPPQVSGSSLPTQYEYDLDGKLERAHLPGGATIDFSYDSHSGFLEGISHSHDWSAIEYDGGGRLAAVRGPEGSSSYTYDGFLPTETVWNGTISSGRIRRSYDNHFRLQAFDVRGGIRVSHAYETDGLLESLSQNGAPLLTLQRNDSLSFGTGALTGTASGLVETDQRYSVLGELASVTARVDDDILWSVDYAYGEDGRITERRERRGVGPEVVTKYSYDARGRLQTVLVDGLVTESYTYDPNGNRLTANGSLPWIYDAEDRLVTAELVTGSTGFTYSARGTLEQRFDSNLSEFEYDAVGNLRSVASPAGRITYNIDPHNRRIAKRVDGVWTQSFLYDGPRIIAELGPYPLPASCDSDADCSDHPCTSGYCLDPNTASFEFNSEVRSQFIYATRSHVPDLMWKVGKLYRLLSDHLGSVHFVVEAATGIVAQELTYDAWGQILTDTNPGFQPFGFAGGLYDSDTKLYRFGARDYDPSIGRWTAKDPILFQGGDPNLYAYVHNNPVKLIDPSGLKTQVIITYSDVGRFFSFGTHAAVRVDNAGDGKAALIDPGGGYMGPTGTERGTRDMFWDRDGDLAPFIRHHTRTGDTVFVLEFDTSPEEERKIAERFGYFDPDGAYSYTGGLCALSVRGGISGIGPFERLFPWGLFPGSLARGIHSAATSVRKYR